MLARLEQEKRLGNFDRYNEEFVKTYKLDKWIKAIPEKEKKAQKLTTIEDKVNLSTIQSF